MSGAEKGAARSRWVQVALGQEHTILLASTGQVYGYAPTPVLRAARTDNFSCVSTDKRGVVGWNSQGGRSSADAKMSQSPSNIVDNKFETRRVIDDDRCVMGDDRCVMGDDRC
eukprot:3932174-Rhodomonas_salina.1